MKDKCYGKLRKLFACAVLCIDSVFMGILLVVFVLLYVLFSLFWRMADCIIKK